MFCLFGFSVGLQRSNPSRQLVFGFMPMRQARRIVAWLIFLTSHHLSLGGTAHRFTCHSLGMMVLINNSWKPQPCRNPVPAKHNPAAVCNHSTGTYLRLWGGLPTDPSDGHTSRLIKFCWDPTYCITSHGTNYPFWSLCLPWSGVINACIQ